MDKEYPYKATCHTKCFWLDTLWEPGNVYEGHEPPNKHFSIDGKKDPEQPPANAGIDPRSTREIRRILRDVYGSTKPKSWTRKQLWQALHEFETGAAKDEAVTPSTKSKRIPKKAE